MDDKSVLRLSLDAKARVDIGSFDRGGRNRALTETEDHDYNPKTTVTPYGIFLPELDELFLYFTESKVTSDFIVDILEDFWKSESWRFSDIKTLILNQDNGGENNSRRTQFLKRILEFAQSNQKLLAFSSDNISDQFTVQLGDHERQICTKTQEDRVRGE